MEIAGFQHTLVDRHNFRRVLPRLLELVGQSAFVAVDTEFTGLGESRDVRAKNIQDRYAAMCKVVREHALLALGLSIFVPVSPPAAGTAGTSAPIPISPAYRVHNFTLLLASIKAYTVSPSSLRFLVTSGFDLNEQIRHGIPYQPGHLSPPGGADPATTSASADASTPATTLPTSSNTKGGRRKQRQQQPQQRHQPPPLPDSAWQLRSLYRALFHGPTKLITHNGLMDLLYLYASFYNHPPTQLDTFIADLEDGFAMGAGCLFDTKYVAEFQDRDASTFLSWVYKKFERQHARDQMAGRALGLEIAAPLVIGEAEDLQVPPTTKSATPPAPTGGKVGAKAKPYCEHYAAHGFCRAGRECTRSHDLDVIFDYLEGMSGPSAAAPASVKRQKLADGEAVDPAMPTPSILVARPTGLVGKYHSASCDAYMTGFIFAHYLARDVAMGVGSSSSASSASPGSPLEEWPLATRMLQLAYRNRLYLIGKDMPLLVERSPYAQCSPFHVAQRASRGDVTASVPGSIVPLPPPAPVSRIPVHPQAQHHSRSDLDKRAMPKYQLELRADSSVNVRSMHPADYRTHAWRLRITCSQCRQPHPRTVVVSLSEEVELARSTAHFAGKCGECKSAAGWSMVVVDAELLRTTMQEAPSPGAGSKACLARVLAGTGRVAADAAADEEDPDAAAEALRTFRPFLQLEARGCEITGWEAGDGYLVESALAPPPGAPARTVIEDVDLVEGEWVEYDDQGNGPLELLGIETRVVKCAK